MSGLFSPHWSPASPSRSAPFSAILPLAPLMSPVTLGVVFGIQSGTKVFLALEKLLPAAKRHAQRREIAYGRWPV